MKTGSTALTIPIAGWNAWDGAYERGDRRGRDIGFIEPMLRRRLSPLGRTALASAFACAKGEDSVRIVYASRHGELERTTELLHSITESADLSPTTFGLSVLNANAGLYAMARHDKASCTAIAAGSESFTYGLIEAWTRAQEAGAPPVLYLYADAPAPPLFAPVEQDVTHPVSVAILINPRNTKTKLTMTWEVHSAPISPIDQATAFLESSCDGNDKSAWQGAVRRWTWHWSSL